MGGGPKSPPFPRGEEPQPELTRSEYLRLLSAAKALGKERTYLLVKVFATTGITVQELPRLTVEAAQAGKVVTYPNRVRQEVRISPCVGRELLEYAHSTGVASGPIFITRNGKTVNRGGGHRLDPKAGGRRSGFRRRNATPGACGSCTLPPRTP